MRKTKNTNLPAWIALVLAVVAAIGVKTFIGPCVHEDGSFGACHWAGQALFGISLLLAAQSICAIAAGTRAEGGQAMCAGIYLVMTLTAITGILFPGTLISLCGMASMRCRALMRPAMTILLALGGVCSLAGFLASLRKAKS